MARPAVNSTLPENGQTTVKATINLNYVVHGLDASVSTQNPELEYNFKSNFTQFCSGISSKSDPVSYHACPVL